MRLMKNVIITVVKNPDTFHHIQCTPGTPIHKNRLKAIPVKVPAKMPSEVALFDKITEFFYKTCYLPLYQSRRCYIQEGLIRRYGFFLFLIYFAVINGRTIRPSKTRDSADVSAEYLLQNDFRNHISRSYPGFPHGACGQGFTANEWIVRGIVSVPELCIF